MTDLNICFVDYVYPYACGENRWAIIDILNTVFKKYNGIETGLICIPSELSFGKEADPDSPVINNCIAFTGVESSTLSQIANQDDLVLIGPVYNYSRDFVIPVLKNDVSDITSNGWGFIYALDWTMWSALFLVIVAALGVQLLMKYISVDVSPTLDRETPAEITSRSILSTIGYSRMYQGDTHIISRHLLSCFMAMFSVIIVSLYGSNLINFFFLNSDTRNYLPPTNAVGVHPSLKDIVSLETFGLFSGQRQSLRIINMMPNAVFYNTIVPVVTRTIGESFVNSSTTLRSIGGYQTIYEVFLRKDFLYSLAERASVSVQDIIIDINQEIYNWRTSQTKLELYIDDSGVTRRGNTSVTISDIYGAFVIIFVGYVASILFRIFFTPKKGLVELLEILSSKYHFWKKNPIQTPTISDVSDVHDENEEVKVREIDIEEDKDLRINIEEVKEHEIELTSLSDDSAEESQPST